MTQTGTGPGVISVGVLGIRIVHFNASGVAQQVGTDFASSWSGYASNGLAWGGVAIDTGSSQPSSVAGANCVSGLVRVNDGDYFQMYFINITGISADIQEGAQMWLEVIEGI